MQYKDLENLTYGELSHFTWDDLMLGKLELLEKIDQDENVPDEIANKLYQLCDDVLKEIPSANISPPTDKELTFKNANEVLKFIINLSTAYKLVPEPIRQKITKGVAECIEMLVILNSK